MKVLILGLCCGMLLAISAVAGERSQDAWFSTLDHNGNGGISLDELKIVRNEKFYLLDINRDKVISPNEVAGSSTWRQRFIRLDANADSLVTLTEFDAMAIAVFFVIDIDADGQITAHEALKFHEKALGQFLSRKVSKNIMAHPDISH